MGRDRPGNEKGEGDKCISSCRPATLAAGRPCWNCVWVAPAQNMMSKHRAREIVTQTAHGRHCSQLTESDKRIPRIGRQDPANCGTVRSSSWNMPRCGHAKLLSFSTRQRGNCEGVPGGKGGQKRCYSIQATHRKAKLDFGKVLLFVLNLVVLGSPGARAVNILYPDGAAMANVGVISVPQGPLVLLSFSGRYELCST